MRLRVAGLALALAAAGAPAAALAAVAGAAAAASVSASVSAPARAAASTAEPTEGEDRACRKGERYASASRADGAHASGVAARAGGEETSRGGVDSGQIELEREQHIDEASSEELARDERVDGATSDRLPEQGADDAASAAGAPESVRRACARDADHAEAVVPPDARYAVEKAVADAAPASYANELRECDSLLSYMQSLVDRHNALAGGHNASAVIKEAATKDFRVLDGRTHNAVDGPERVAQADGGSAQGSESDGAGGGIHTSDRVAPTSDADDTKAPTGGMACADQVLVHESALAAAHAHSSRLESSERAARERVIELQRTLAELRQARLDEAEERVQLRWENACLRHENRRAMRSPRMSPLGSFKSEGSPAHARLAAGAILNGAMGVDGEGGATPIAGGGGADDAAGRVAAHADDTLVRCADVVSKSTGGIPGARITGPSTPASRRRGARYERALRVLRRIGTARNHGSGLQSPGADVVERGCSDGLGAGGASVCQRESGWDGRGDGGPAITGRGAPESGVITEGDTGVGGDGRLTGIEAGNANNRGVGPGSAGQGDSAGAANAPSTAHVGMDVGVQTDPEPHRTRALRRANTSPALGKQLRSLSAASPDGRPPRGKRKTVLSRKSVETPLSESSTSSRAISCTDVQFPISVCAHSCRARSPRVVSVARWSRAWRVQA